MKKTVIVTLELDSDEELTKEQIEDDIKQEINCATYFYTVKDVECK